MSVRMLFFLCMFRSNLKWEIKFKNDVSFKGESTDLVSGVIQ